jgi:phosphatidylinositol alpha-1,6-mannosyltransferase
MKQIALVITRNLPPLIGGMERLIWHLIDELRSDYQVHVAGPFGCKEYLPADVTAIEIPVKPMAIFLFRVKIIALWVALRHRPCIVLAGSGLTAPVAWLAARLTGARCVVYLHGLDITADNLFYRLFWVPIFRRFDCVLVNSNFTKDLALKAKILPSRITILHPGVDLPNMDNASRSHRVFRSRHVLDEIPIMLYVGRFTPRKGLFYFINEIMPQIIIEIPKAVLVVIGDEPINALLSDKNQYGSVQLAIKENNLDSNVRLLGSCSDQELGEAYFSADVLVFPVQNRENDIEGFGMVALEAAAHGLPTVAFSVGGVPDAIADGYSGKLFSPDDKIGYTKTVIEFLNGNNVSSQVNDCRNFAESLQWSMFGARLRDICKSTVTGERTYEDI